MSAESETETKHSGSSTKSAEPAPKKARSRKRGGCLGCAFVTLLVAVPTLLFLLNGPLARMGAEFAISHFAEGQGIHGGITVDGTILSGFTLSEGQFEGDAEAPLRKAKIDHLEIRYDLWDWIQQGGVSGLREIQIHDVAAHVVLPEPTDDEPDDEPEPEPDDSSGSPLPLDPELLAQLLAVRYSLQNIDLVLEQGPDSTYEIQDFTLVLEPGGAGTLSLGRLTIPDKPAWENIETSLLLTANSITLGPLVLDDSIELRQLSLQLLESGAPVAAAQLNLYGADLEASYGEAQDIHLALRQGVLPVGRILERFPVEDLTAGEVSKLDLNFQGDFMTPATWAGDLIIHLSEAAWQDYGAENIRLNLSLDPTPGRAESVSLQLAAPGLALDATGELSLESTQDFEGLSSLPAEIKASCRVSSVEEAIAAFAADLAPKLPLTGDLEADVEVTLVGPRLVTAKAAARSQSLTYETIPIDRITASALQQEGAPLGFDVEVDLDDTTQLSTTGKFDLEAKTYEAELQGKLDLEQRLTAVLEALGQTTSYAGAATLTWSGSGALPDQNHRGEFSFDAAGVKIGEAEPFDGAATGSYDNLDLRLTQLNLSSRLIQVEAAASYVDAVLELPRLAIRSDELLLLEGRIKAPLAQEVFSAPTEFFLQDGEVDIDVQSHDLELQALLGHFHQSPPVTCRLNLDLKASGTPGDLRLESKLVADEIAAQAGISELLDEKIQPAKAIINLSIADSVMTLGGTVEQPQIEPFVLDGSLPFHPAQWLDGSRDFMTEPMTASARMRESSLSFLTALTPAIATIEGTIDLDVSLEGSLKQPQLGGKSDLKLNTLNFTSPSAPSARDLVANLRFQERSVYLDRFEGILAGGQIGMKGQVDLPEEGAPIIDLRLGGQEVLVFRSDSTSVRTDLNLTLQGPIPTAALGGTIGITSSLFYKDFDLLPVGNFSGRGGESAIPEVDPGPRMPLPKSLEVGVPIAPFKDWPVDLEIVTLDPFRIAGNLAQAEVENDLKITGTLGTPIPRGRTWVPTGRLRLPFSEIDLSDAAITFDESTGFNGQLGMRARSKVGDYWVSIFAQGQILEPEITFTSVPPLSREDIISLLGSGSTREQLSNGGGAAATKAAIYYLKSLNNKEGKIDPDAPPSFADTLEERSNVSIGKIDPDTGERSIDASIRLWRESYLGFSFGAEGSHRGVLKYLFRFE